MAEVDTNKTVPDTNSSKSWLQRLKEESWEAELLVSTVAIFGTFQLFGIIDWATNMFINLLSPSQYFIGYMIVFFGLLAISILASMFVLHFVLRAYWVGLVGLNSVFPDYSIADSAYSEIYTKKILSILPKLKESIDKVDQLCSVVFSVAFTFMFVYFYLAFISTLFLLFFNLLSSYIPTNLLMIPVYVFVLLLTVQTVFSIIANLKMFKKNEKIQILYFNLVKFGSILQFGPLYKSILQISMIFGSNFKKKKSMVYLLLTFLIFGASLSLVKVFNTNIFYLSANKANIDTTKLLSEYYESANENNTFLLSPEITSDIVKTNVVKIFIPIYRHEDKMRQETCGAYIKDEERTKGEERQDRKIFYLECYHACNYVYLNGEKVVIDFLKYEHPRTKQFGILGYIKLSDKKEGRNTIKVKKVFDEEQYNKEWSIPFYYAVE